MKVFGVHHIQDLDGEMHGHLNKRKKIQWQERVRETWKGLRRW